MRIIKAFIAPAFISLVGVVMIVTGIKNDELIEIMQKAIIICLECIGFG